MSQRNQEAKRVYMLKDNIFLKDEQLKRKKTQIMKTIFVLWRSQLLCVTCALNWWCLSAEFFQPILEQTYMYYYMVPYIDNLMLAEDGTKLPCNDVHITVTGIPTRVKYNKNSRAILLKQKTWAETWFIFSCLDLFISFIGILIFLSIIVTDILEEKLRMSLDWHLLWGKWLWSCYTNKLRLFYFLIKGKGVHFFFS